MCVVGIWSIPTQSREAVLQELRVIHPGTSKMKAYDMVTFGDYKWSTFHLDFAGPFLEHMFLVLVDSYSEWMDIRLLSSITSSKTIDQLRIIFYLHGLPQKIVTENG